MSDTIRDRVDADTARALAAAYPAVGPDDDLTNVLDHWAETRTGSCTVIDVIPASNGPRL